MKYVKLLGWIALLGLTTVGGSLAGGYIGKNIGELVAKEFIE